jgi:hypothetical protein
MQTKPIFIGLAAGILVVVVAAASFFAGLYVGQRGYVDSLQYQPQQAQQFQPNQGGQFQPNQGGQSPNGQSPNGQTGQPGTNQTAPGAGQANRSGTGPVGAPYWPPDLIGRIVSVSDTEIVINNPTGDVTVPVNADTKYIDPQGQTITTDQLTVGIVIGIFGNPTATTVMLLPPPPNQQQ